MTPLGIADLSSWVNSSLNATGVSLLAIKVLSFRRIVHPDITKSTAQTQMHDLILLNSVRILFSLICKFYASSL